MSKLGRMAKMAKYRKKPVVIEAVRWEPDKPARGLPDWFLKMLAMNPERYDEATGDLLIQTLEGAMIARPGDYIIRGVEGEVYPCKSSIFEATYEPASDAGGEGEGQR